jgi:hypothetical protein
VNNLHTRLSRWVYNAKQVLFFIGFALLLCVTEPVIFALDKIRHARRQTTAVELIAIALFTVGRFVS